MKKKKQGSELVQKLSSLKTELDIAYGEFDRESGSDMIDARIYNINSLKAQYAHYLALARNEGVTGIERVSDGHGIFQASPQKRDER